MSMLDYQRFDAVPLESDPCPYLVVPGFVTPAAMNAINAAYPAISDAGNFPLETLTYGPVFKAFVDELTGDEMRRHFAAKFAMNLMGLFALISLALASLGLYGVLAYAVSQRTKEFGIRMALGADRARLLHQVIREGAMLTVGGVFLGVAGSFAAARLIGSLLVGVDAKDPRTFAAVSLSLMIVAAAASYIPARRATRVDPMIALRHE